MGGKINVRYRVKEQVEEEGQRERYKTDRRGIDGHG